MKHVSKTPFADDGSRQVLLEEIVRRIVELARPDRIILFGSSGRGEAHAESDFDLLIVKSGVTERRRVAQAIYRCLSGLRASVDVVVVSEDDLRQFGGKVGTIIPIALREGKTVYAA